MCSFIKKFLPITYRNEGNIPKGPSLFKLNIETYFKIREGP